MYDHSCIRQEMACYTAGRSVGVFHQVPCEAASDPSVGNFNQAIPIGSTGLPISFANPLVNVSVHL